MNNKPDRISTIKSLHKATIALTKRVNVDILLQQILDSARELLEAKYAAIGIFNEQGTISQFITSGLEQPANNSMPLPTDASLLGHIYRHNKLMRIANLSNQGYMQHIPPNHPIMKSFLGLPIIVEETTVGALYLTDKLNDDNEIIDFSIEDEDLIEMLVAHAGVAWQNTRLYQTMNHLVDHYYQKSVTDSLTGLFNRRQFDERLEQEINRAQRYQRPLSLIMLDIDHFKKVNDSYGHPAGDQLLRQLSRHLFEAIRQFDTVYRYGGEEFTIILPESNLDGALILAERLRTKIEATPTFYEGHHIEVTISLGVVELHDNISTAELIHIVDKALYKAKQNGRNQVAIAS